jgi:hypothetical protein
MTFALTIRTSDELAAEARAAAERDIAAAIDARVEAQARELGYNSAAHLAGYVSSTVPQWAAEAQAFVAWRDAVWLAAFEVQTQALAAQEVPSLDDVLAALPAWEGVP